MILLALETVTSLVAAPVLAAPSAAVRSVPSLVATTQVSSDPFTNGSSYHATEVEPDTYAAGSTIVGAFQAGRSFNGGSAGSRWSSPTVQSSSPILGFGYIGSFVSTNGGKTWSAPVQVGRPTLLGRIAPTDSGRMVGDYIGTAIASGRAFAVIAVGLPAAGHRAFNEPMVVVSGGEPMTGGPHAIQSAVSGTPAAGRVLVSPTPPRSF